MRRIFFTFLPIAILFALASCHGHEHPDDHGASHDAGDEHAHGEEGHGPHDASESVTRWGQKTQLFVEFPALVTGEDSLFAAHFTRLRDHAPITQGMVVVELSGGGKPDEQFTAIQPASPGIFRPLVRPVHLGERQVTIRLMAPPTVEALDLGTFVVHATRDEANAAAAADEAPADAVSFLLEQQWRIPFAVQPAESRPLRPNIPAFGELSLPHEHEVLIIAPRDGRLIASGSRFPRIGESVSAGSAPFALSLMPQDDIDPANLDTAVEQAAIGVEEAKRELTRRTNLAERGMIEAQLLEEARFELREAEAEWRGAKRLRESHGQGQRIADGGERFEVPIPVSGTLAEIYVAPGTWVAEEQPIARIIDRGSLHLEIGVPEAYVGRLKEVTGAWFHLDGHETPFELGGSDLVAVGSELDHETRVLPVRFRIDNAAGELYPGMTTTAHLVVASPIQSVAIPFDAVVHDAGTEVVYVQSGGETFERRPVRLGVRDGDWVAVLDGVSPGEWVVARGAYSIKLAATSTSSIGHGHAH